MDINKELQKAVQVVENMSTREFKKLCNEAGYFPEESIECEGYSPSDIHSVVRNITKAYDSQVEKCLERYLSVKLKVDVPKVKKLLENFNNVKLKGIEDHCFIRREGFTKRRI